MLIDKLKKVWYNNNRDKERPYQNNFQMTAEVIKTEKVGMVWQTQQ